MPFTKGAVMKNENENEEEVTTAVEGFCEPSENKNASWQKLGDSAIIDFPSGKSISFDLKPLSTEVLKFYGGKQFLADKVASCITEIDKRIKMVEVYNEAVVKGLELSPTGKVRITGKARSNAASGDRILAGAVKAASKVISLEGLVLKKAVAALPGQPEFTETDQKKLDEFLAVVAGK